MNYFGTTTVAMNLAPLEPVIDLCACGNTS
jgi:hypothetical protein